MAAPPTARADKEQRAFCGTDGNEGEGKCGGAILPRGVDFVEPAAVQPRNPGCFMRKARKMRALL